MRFIADAMLGRLARWMRLLGFDTLYLPDISDRMLLKTARQQERFILTRDSHFLRADIDNCLHIKSDHVAEQLLQVMQDLGLTPLSDARCAVCNGRLEHVREKTSVRDSVPEHVYMSLNRFQRCTQCEKIYWQGSHYRNFMDTVKVTLSAKGG
jgi:uncharacterized protein with PIN domain